MPKRETLSEQIDDDQDEQEITFERDYLLIEVLRGGDASNRIESLYSAYWALLKAVQIALKNRSSAEKLANSKTFADFLNVTSKMTPILPPPSSNTTSAFKTLPPIVKNLLMAATELNIKLSTSEQAISQNLSELYLHAAKEGAQCVYEQSKRLSEAEKNIASRTNALHMSALQSLMGQRYAAFTTQTLQSLHQWHILGSRLGIQISKQDYSSVEGLCEALQDTKRLISNTKLSLARPQLHSSLGNTQEEESRNYGLRMQKHKIAIERTQKVDSLRDSPLELAKSLRLLRVADEEIDASLSVKKNSIVIPKSEEIVQEKNYELEQLSRDIDVLVDQGHVLSYESNQIKLGLEKNVRNEASKEINSAHSYALECVESSKMRLSNQLAESLRIYEQKVKDTREAEKTLAAELSVHGSVNNAALEVCGKAIAEASKARKISTDAEILNLHKKSLHDIGMILHRILLEI